MDIQNNRFTYNLADLIPADINLSGESYGQQYDIISKVAYLIGVPKKIFENENVPPKLDIYNRMELEKKARIIRNLCSLRTQLERNFLKVCQGILVHAYATTIHKAQGSEYPIVVMPVLMNHYVMLQRNLIYMGITRAKKIKPLLSSYSIKLILITNYKNILFYNPPHEK